MLAPVRVWYSLQRRSDAGLLAAAVSVSVLFTATPFLLPALTREFGVSLGAAGLLSTAQVGGFAATAFAAGRLLTTRRRHLIVGSVLLTVANLASVVVEEFGPLLIVRAVAGAAAGLLVWLSWAHAMRDRGGMKSVAASGPVSVLIAAPILATVADRWGTDGVFLLLAALSAPAIMLPARFGKVAVERRRVSPSRSNVILVVTLGFITLAGSSLYVFTAAIGTEVLGLDPTVTSLAFSLNALAGLIAARISARSRPQALWLLGMAASVAVVTFGRHPIFFMMGMAAWGFFFWLSTPNLLTSVAAWSLAPEERTGDAQSTMAVGRALGPAVGGLLVADGEFTAVGVFATVVLAICAMVVWRVQAYRTTHSPPAGAVAVAGS